MARHMDPHDRVSTLSIVAGMVLMAASLIAIAHSTGSPAEDPAAAGGGSNATDPVAAAMAAAAGLPA